jgi:hypothetical protein
MSRHAELASQTADCLPGLVALANLSYLTLRQSRPDVALAARHGFWLHPHPVTVAAS